MSYQEILDNLGGYEKSGVFGDLGGGLEKMHTALDKLGNPQDKYPIIHVVGSKGKGSTVRLIEQGLIEAGLKVGSYYSPHIYRVNERIRFNGEEISDHDLDRLVHEVPTDSLTYFEFLTVCAFKFFADKGADYAVIEAGLGGRLDATNTAKEPAVVVLTHIEKEHTDILGDTIEEIEREKLGVLRGGAKLFRDGSNEELASQVLEYLGYTMPKSPLPLPGRFEVRDGCVFDMAHTQSSAMLLRKRLEREFPGSKFFFVMSFLKGKNPRVIIEELVHEHDELILVTMDDPRAMSSEELSEFGTVGVIPTSWPDGYVPVMCGSARLLKEV